MEYEARGFKFTVHSVQCKLQSIQHAISSLQSAVCIENATSERNAFQ